MSRVLLLCAGGMSSSIVMKRLRSYAREHGIDCELKATGISSYRDIVSQYDCVLLAPQARYYLRRVEKVSSVPIGVIPPSDYGGGDVSNIFALISTLIARGEHADREACWDAEE